MAVEHVVVLCLENRSFDHMLGYLPHPDPRFAGLRGGPWTNPDASGKAVPASADAKSVLPFGPDHSHDAVMQQLALQGPAWNRRPTHQGFVASYDLRASGRSPPRYGGPLGILRRWLSSLTSRRLPGTPPGNDDVGEASCGPLVMRCQDPARVPVLATLATEFAVFDHWYCSVPGETWPNRNYLHAATSDGETNIQIRPYLNPTIFELLEEHGRDWRIYHEGLAQAWAFPKLWDTPERHARWFPMGSFADHVAAGDLPAYTFIEPDHKPPGRPLDQLQSLGAPLGVGNSQHPENNLVGQSAYTGFTPDRETDFARGERLIASVYEALRANPELFATTVLVITYDEHGGLYDHLPAPERVPAPGDNKHLTARILDALYRQNATSFDFTRLGVRVPTVVVSPLINRTTLEQDVFEHASVPATLRALFAPNAPPLTARDAHARTFHHLWEQHRPPRTDLPNLAEHTRPPAAPPSDVAPTASATAGTGEATPAPDQPEIRPTSPPDYYRDFLAQADAVGTHLHQVGEPEATSLPTTSSTHIHDGDGTAAAFAQAAQRHRAEAH